ncbi:MAG: hypothetical protein RLP16_06570 [Alphaproteobacteria bacterium]
MARIVRHMIVQQPATTSWPRPRDWLQKMRESSGFIALAAVGLIAAAGVISAALLARALWPA